MENHENYKPDVDAIRPVLVQIYEKYNNNPNKPTWSIGELYDKIYGDIHDKPEKLEEFKRNLKWMELRKAVIIDNNFKSIKANLPKLKSLINNPYPKNPIPTVDTIIKRNSQILFVRGKKEPFKDRLAFPGGFVNEGERVEEAAKREVKEETALDIELDSILGVYSDPNRDPRGHIISTVFIGRISGNKGSRKEPITGDDAAEIRWVDIESMDKESFGFDHIKILSDYKKWKQSNETYWSSKEDRN